jgi:hypothetical protein
VVTGGRAEEDHGSGRYGAGEENDPPPHD